MRKYINTYTHIYIHTFIHTYIHNTYIHTYIYTYIHNTYIHTHTHTHTPKATKAHSPFVTQNVLKLQLVTYATIIQLLIKLKNLCFVSTNKWK